MLDEFRRFARTLKQTSRLMVGIPDYDTYVAHREKNHPGKPIMTYEEFFIDRQNARFGANGQIGRCC